MSDNHEKFYDEEIAPVLVELAKKCQDRGLSMVASVQYGTGEGERGDTYIIQEDAQLPIVMVRLMAKAAPNIDSVMISLTRYCREKGIDTSSSIYLNRTGRPGG